MSIIIGGSSSSGSSLLQTILNRHSHIYCGPETSLFCKRGLFLKWKKNKNRILSSGWSALRNHSWFLLNGVHIFNKTAIWSCGEIQDIINKSITFQQFVDLYFAKYLDHFGKRFWIEKTPSNVVNFELFLNSFTKSKVVHVVRNPYDTITSLIKRGFTPYFACGLYLFNTASGLSARDDDNYFQICYENLVMDSKSELKKICNHLGFDFEEEMMDFKKNNLDMVNKIEGWSYDASESIGATSIGSFNRLGEQLKEEIKTISSLMVLHGSHRKKENSIREICQILGYEYQESHQNITIKHKLYRYWDMINRTARNYPTHLFNYPISFKYS